MIALPGYYNRFDESQNYQDLLFRAGKGLQSAELNEVQSALTNRFKRVADAVFRDGAVISGESPIIDENTGAITCPESVIYAAGAMRTVPEASFVIPTVGQVAVGVYLVYAEITELEDPSLRDPATGTRNYQEPGAGRLMVTASWGHDGDGQEGDFYSVYKVVDGSLYTPPPLSSAFLDTLARYDRESNGNYIADGLVLSALAPGVFSVSPGVGNVYGYKIDITTSRRLVHDLDPDLEEVTSEPNTYVDSTTDIQLNRYPVNSIDGIVAAKEKTVTLTRGSAGGADALPDVSVLRVESVTQGDTTYTEGADYTLSGDTISWAPSGAEPAPGSTYQVIYVYLTTFAPTEADLDAGTLRIEGAVAGELVLVDYNWKLPRYDRICLNRQGQLVRLKGTSGRYRIFPPRVPGDLLWIGTIRQQWVGTPKVNSDGTRNVPYSELQRQRSLVLDLFDLVAQERLRWETTEREPTSKRGVFVDPLLDDNMRDQGIPQSGAIVLGTLQLPIEPVVIYATKNNNQSWMLPFVEETVLAQSLITRGERVNPYGGFNPLEGGLTLTPNTDRWTVRVVNWASPNSRRFTTILDFLQAEGIEPVLDGRWWGHGGFHWGEDIQDWRGTIEGGWDGRTHPHGQMAVWRRDELMSIGRSSGNIRELMVHFHITGFNPSEVVVTLTFDGLDVLPGPLVCNSSGEAEGEFQIPPGIPSGAKAVVAQGNFGSTARAMYFGESLIVTENMRRQEVAVWDPLAQTFRLEQSRWITSIDVWFTTIGSTDNPVQLQIRETIVGMPSSIAVATGEIDMSTVTTGQWTTIALDTPVWLPADEEYAIVLLTDDLVHAVGIAEIGHQDLNTGEWTTSLPYLIGTFLKSSNGVTWTPHQEADLTFRINAASFTSPNRTIDLGEVKTIDADTVEFDGGTVTITGPYHNLSDGQLVVVAGADQSEYNGSHEITVINDTTFSYPISGSPASPATGDVYVVPGGVSDLLVLSSVEAPTSNTGVLFDLIGAESGRVLTLPPVANTPLAQRITEGMTLQARLFGTATESPMLMGGTQLVLGRLEVEGDYVSRAVPCAPNAQVVVTFDAILPSGSSIIVEVQDDVGEWEALPQTASTDLGDNLIEYTYRTDNFESGGAETRCRLTLGGDAAYRPFIRNLRMFVI